MKNFSPWFQKKQQLHEQGNIEYFKKREIWFCALGINIGDEEDGKHENFERPVLIVTKYNKRLFFAIPLSTVPKENHIYVNFEYEGRVFGAMVGQARTLDVRRLIRKIGTMSEGEFQKITDQLVSDIKNGPRRIEGLGARRQFVTPV